MPPASTVITGKSGVIMQITGVDAIDRKLATFTNRLRNKIVRRGLRRAARPVQATMKRLIQKDTKAVMTTIRIRSHKRTRTSKYRLVIQVRTEVKYLHTVHTRIPTVFNPHWLEFGVPNHHWFPPGQFPFRPFARPAVKVNRTKVIAIFQIIVASEVAAIP